MLRTRRARGRPEVVEVLQRGSEGAGRGARESMALAGYGMIGRRFARVRRLVQALGRYATVPGRFGIAYRVWHGPGLCKAEAPTQREQGCLVGWTVMHDVVLSCLPGQSGQGQWAVSAAAEPALASTRLCNCAQGCAMYK